MKQLVLFFIMSFTLSSWAFVGMKNSNFADSWIDYRVTGPGYQLKIQRTYNSRSTYDGLFGFGWCSDFETRLDVMPDNSLKITECGGGLEISYVTGEVLKGSKLKAYISKIVELSKSVNPKLKKPYLKRLRKDLKENQYLREALAKKLGLKGQIKDNSSFYARGRGGEKIIFKNNVYKRTLFDGTFQKFNKKGKLVSLYDRNSNYLKLIYTNGNISQVIDNSGKRIEFKYHLNGKVKEVRAPGGYKSIYTYNGQDLVEVTNAWKVKYKYAYDKLHNLERVDFPDKTSKEIFYDADKDLVMGFKDRNNCKEKYVYKGSKKDARNHYWSLITKTCNGKVTNRSKYEFWHRLKSDGTGKYLYRVVSDNNGKKIDIVYHDIFGKPTSLKEGKKQVWYQYSSLGLLTEKKTPVEKIRYSYEPYCKKVSKIIKEGFKDYKNIDKATSREVAKFSYTRPRCNLNQAINSKGVRVRVGYDRFGRISKLIDQTEKYVSLSYDKVFGKPNVVRRPGLGEIKILYDKNGKMKEVTSKQGTEVAAQVAGVFNNLLEIVAPVTQGLNI